jgi:hypothetical protein
VLGLRFNVWTSIVLFVAAAAYFIWSSRNRPGREETVYVDGRISEVETDVSTTEKTVTDDSDVTDEASTSD